MRVCHSTTRAPGGVRPRGQWAGRYAFALEFASVFDAEQSFFSFLGFRVLVELARDPEEIECLERHGGALRFQSDLDLEG